MIFYRTMIKITHPNGKQWIEIISYKNLTYARETAERYVNAILHAASHSNGCYTLSLPFNNETGYFYNDEIVQIVIEKVEKITHETNKRADLDEEYASIKSSKDIVEYKTLFEYAPGLWSTTSIL